ncbi:AtpZ/AtpI family protein [Rickettsiales bacterium]|nr:AtpZ/AtpI family protein [Rickettsiales bacterium]
MNKKIQEFKQKLEAFENNKKSNLKHIKNNNAFGLGLKISLDLVVSIIVGILIGLGIDKLFNTKPIFFLIFFILGIAAGFFNIYRLILNLEKKNNHR